jgi:hypothetical protein
MDSMQGTQGWKRWQRMCASSGVNPHLATSLLSRPTAPAPRAPLTNGTKNDGTYAQYLRDLVKAKPANDRKGSYTASAAESGSDGTADDGSQGTTANGSQQARAVKVAQIRQALANPQSYLLALRSRRSN